MKKILILASVLLFATASFATSDTKTIQTNDSTLNQSKPYCKMPPPKGPEFKKRHEEFEKRLNLTDEQKSMAKQLREEGFEKMKPIMEKTKQKQQEAAQLKTNGDTEKLEQVKKQIGALKREAHEIRMQDMKKFENILTKTQKEELKKMKKEGRKHFEQEHRRPHGGFGPRPDRPLPIQNEAK